MGQISTKPWNTFCGCIPWDSCQCCNYSDNNQSSNNQSSNNQSSNNQRGQPQMEWDHTITTLQNVQSQNQFQGQSYWDPYLSRWIYPNPNQGGTII